MTLSIHRERGNQSNTYETQIKTIIKFHCMPSTITFMYTGTFQHYLNGKSRNIQNDSKITG